MPNTPSMVKEGMMGMCAGARVTDEDMALVRDLCSGFSQTEVIPEHLMDVVTAVSGSSPAYVFMFIEAMADAAVAGGMPRQQAYKFAAQAVLGSAKMVLETGKHPGELKDMVCSPAGTTIQSACLRLSYYSFEYQCHHPATFCRSPAGSSSIDFILPIFDRIEKGRLSSVLL